MEVDVLCVTFLLSFKFATSQMMHRSILGHLWTQRVMVVNEIDFCSDDSGFYHTFVSYDNVLSLKAFA